MREQLRVAIDVSAGRRPGSDRGIGRYLAAVRSANAAMANELTELSFPIGNGVFSEFWPLVPRSLRTKASRVDLFHALGPSYYAPSIAAQVVSILDVIPLDVAAVTRTGLKQALFHRLAARARSFATLSQHAKTRIVARTGIAPDLITVAPLPSILPRPSREPKLSLPERYVVALVDLRAPDPRKRIEWIQGIAAGLSKRGVAFAVAGPGTEGAHARFPGALMFGRLEDCDLSELLARARAFVYTSAYEGQGLPPLEAINLGTPVVAMNNSSLPEVIGHAGVLIDEDQDLAAAACGPHRESDPAVPRLIDACVRLFEDERQQALLAALCEGQAKLFTRDRFESGIRDAYRRATEE